MADGIIVVLFVVGIMIVALALQIALEYDEISEEDWEYFLERNRDDE